MKSNKKSTPSEVEITVCGCCNQRLMQEEAEVCWFCGNSLCVDCWEEQGHCGHDAAMMANVWGRAFELQKGLLV